MPKIKLYFLIVFNLLFIGSISAQIPAAGQTLQPSVGQFSADDLKNIADGIGRISKTLDGLNAKMNNFAATFSSNQGLKLDEKQQKILFAFEVLNRAEQRLNNLQNLKLTLSDKQTALRLQSARNSDNLLPESIDRYVSTRGSLNAEQLRDLRRQALYKEKSDISNLLADIENSLRSSNEEIRETEMFLANIRRRIFPQIAQELSDF